MSKRKSKDDWLVNLIAGVIVFAIFAVVIGGLIYVRAAAPCKYIDWMPAKDVPARCFTVHNR